MTNPELTLLVPAFNEEQNLADYLPELVQAASGCTRRYEILVVDDGSRDAGMDRVRALMKNNRRIRLVRHPANLGPGAAIPTGLFWARGDWVMLVPADLGCQPSRLWDLWRAREGADLVVGLRSDRRDYSLWRKALSFGYIALLRGLTGSGIRQFNFLQLYRRKIFGDLPVDSRGVFVTAEIILRAERAGLAIRQVPLDYRPRTSGRARGASPRALLRTAVEMTTYLAGW